MASEPGSAASGPAETLRTPKGLGAKPLFGQKWRKLRSQGKAKLHSRRRAQSKAERHQSPPRSLTPQLWVAEFFFHLTGRQPGSGLGDAKKRISSPEGPPKRLSRSRNWSCSLKSEAEALWVLPLVSSGAGSKSWSSVAPRRRRRVAAWERRA